MGLKLPTTKNLNSNFFSLLKSNWNVFLLFLFSLRIQFTAPDAATLVLAFMHCFNLLISCLRNWLNLKTHIQVVLTVWCFIKIVTINHVHSFSFKHKQGLQHQQRDPPPTKSTYPTPTIHYTHTFHPQVQSKVYSISGIFEIRWEIIKDESDVAFSGTTCKF